MRPICTGRGEGVGGAPKHDDAQTHGEKNGLCAWLEQSAEQLKQSRVQLVRRDGRDVPTLYGREEGGGEIPTTISLQHAVIHPPPKPPARGSQRLRSGFERRHGRCRSGQHPATFHPRKEAVPRRAVELQRSAGCSCKV